MKDHFTFVTHALSTQILEVRCITHQGILSFYDGECSYESFGQDGFDAEVEFQYTLNNHRKHGWIEIE